MDEITGFVELFSHLPTGWKIVFMAVFFLLPKVVSMVGGTEAIKKASSAIWEFIKTVVRNIQARKQMQVEDKALTEAYTRTLVVETLSMFAFRLERMDHKINWIIHQMDPSAKIEEIELKKPTRDLTDTVIHDRKELMERIAKRDRDW